MAAAPDHSFATCYMELCRQQRLRPLPMICVTLPHTLDFTTDRVKMDDWAPILNSLSLDRTLRSINVRSKYQHRKLLEHANSESKARAVGKAPVVLTRFLVEWLSHSVSQCVRNSTNLTCLEIEGIPVPADCLAVLCVGLASTKSLQHLSLQRCYIGDAGCKLVCRTLANLQSIRSLNLSQCDLTSAAGPDLASALSRQKLALYHDAWKQSLRYREPKLESMPGLRRLTLNGNVRLGNEAVVAIIEAIRDSLWFKALDLQQCGLTEGISGELLELLQHNQTLAVVDVRLNPSLHEDTLEEIDRRLQRNELHSKSEYRWLGLPQSKEAVAAAGKRVSSAGNLQSKTKQPGEQEAKPAVRPRSAIVRQVKRPPAPIVYRKPVLTPASQAIKRMKIKPAVPTVDRRPRQPLKATALPALPPPPQPEPASAKIALHLDLQSQIQTVSDSTAKEATTQLSGGAGGESKSSADLKLEPEARRLQEVMRELLEAQSERERLREEKQQSDMALAEERARREFAEAKLRSAKSDMSELEEVIRRQDRDARGFLLISQKSMEEICLSFARLLDMLEAAGRESRSQSDLEPEEESHVAREDIKRRFALIIRKTKSENLKRGYFVDEDTVLSRLQMTARYGRSEGNIRTTVEPIDPAVVRIERHIGDTGDGSTLPRIVQGNPRAQQRYGGTARLAVAAAAAAKGDGEAASPSDRARALFASLVNGNAVLGFNADWR